MQRGSSTTTTPRLRAATAAALVFSAGCVAGITWAGLDSPAAPTSPATTPVLSTPSRAAERGWPELSPRRGVQAEPQAPVVTLVRDDLTLATVLERLDAERAERERIDMELRRVRAALAALESRLESVALADRDRPAEYGGTPGNLERPRVDADSLIDAGFEVEQASLIAERWGVQQMALLELRNQATREGWMGSSRYNEALRELSSGAESLRGSLQEDDYDRFLYAAGRNNRVRVDGIIEFTGTGGGPGAG